jgi:hypothetical protein
MIGIKLRPAPGAPPAHPLVADQGMADYQAGAGRRGRGELVIVPGALRGAPSTSYGLAGVLCFPA